MAVGDMAAGDHGHGAVDHRYSLQDHGGPSFFDQNEFLVSNSAMLLFVRLPCGRRGHCAAQYRLAPAADVLQLRHPDRAGNRPPGANPLLEPYAWWIGGVGISLIFPVIGMMADKRRYGAIHPAWFVGVGSVLGVQIVADLFAYSATGIALHPLVPRGTPGAMRSMQAFLPPA